MQKSEKTAEPSMEEILASIRKIIAEEPPQAPEAPPAAPVARSEPLDAAMKDLVGPPGDDLSDMLDEPAQQEAPAEPAQLAAAASGLADLGAEAAKPEIEAAKSPFTQADDPGESPLMARLRGLAVTTNGATAPANVGSQAVDPGPDTPQPFAKQVNEPAQPTSEAPAEDSDSANRSLQDAILDAKSDTSEGPNGALAGGITETVFGKSAAACTEPVPISIGPESEAGAEQATGNTNEKAAEPAPEAISTSSTSNGPSSIGAEQPIKADTLPVDDAFASLTNDPAVEEQPEAQPLPVLPHQEIAEEQPEPVMAAPVAPVSPEIAPVDESVEPEAVAETQADTPSSSSPRADLEVALAALVEPVVTRWLADNVPAMVERILAEKMKDK
ncbi:MAG: hypothetical protein CBC34_001325 [Hyphomicrobiaceae bacterium TMED74]|nr:hypothetical protein [Filomicrobium sp.]RPG47866.1 MAG: hypothetical protein CBC34_001325 [Hyphomicrobiaceae bacterium TMED74]